MVSYTKIPATAIINTTASPTKATLRWVAWATVSIDLFIDMVRIEMMQAPNIMFLVVL